MTGGGERWTESAGELAWRIERLVEAGIALRSDGWCFGVPHPSEVRVEENGVFAAGRRSGAERRHRAHLRRGHDEGCRVFGVPHATIVRFLAAWDRAGAALLVLEAWDCAVAEIAASPAGWNAGRAREAFAHALRSRITPRERASQIPRSASNAPASKRCFIWVRKRAASAPSIVR